MFNSYLYLDFEQVGGTEEYHLVSAMKSGRVNKPVVAWCIGTCAKMFTSDVRVSKTNKDICFVYFSILSFQFKNLWIGALKLNKSRKTANLHIFWKENYIPMHILQVFNLNIPISMEIVTIMMVWYCYFRYNLAMQGRVQMQKLKQHQQKTRLWLMLKPMSPKVLMNWAH